MQRKKDALIAIAASIVLQLCMSFLSSGTISERIKHHSHVRTAQENAYNYLNKKYGFEKNKIRLSENKPAFRMLEDDMEKGVFDARHDESEFRVIVCCTEKNDMGWDSFQYDEIYSAVSEMINSEISGYENIEMTGLTLFTEFKSPDDKYGGIIKKHVIDRETVSAYYDGNNLDDVIKELHVEAEFYIPENNYSESFFSKKLGELGIEYKITSDGTD